MTDLAEGDRSRRATFREVFRRDPHPHPNSLFVRLPAGVDIADVRIRVSVRDTGWELSDKRNAVADAAAATDGLPLRDRNGAITWRIRTTRGFDDGGRVSVVPHAADDLTFALLDRTRRTLGYAHGVDFPTGDRDGVTAYHWPQVWTLGLPLVQWDNPTGRAVTLRAEGRLVLHWLESAKDAVEVVLVATGIDGRKTRLLETQLTPPADGSRSAPVPLSGLPEFIVGPHGRVLVGHRPSQSGHRQQTRLEDRLGLTLVK